MGDSVSALTEEEMDFVRHMVEDCHGLINEIAERYKTFFGTDYITLKKIDDLNRYRRQYIMDRFGTKYYSPVKIRAFHGFERGQNAADVSGEFNIPYSTAEIYYNAWRSLGGVKKPAPKKNFHGIYTGSGCMFSRYTNRSTIWMG